MYAPLVSPRLDANGDGWLTKAEMLTLFHDFCYSDDPGNPANNMFGPLLNPHENHHNPRRVDDGPAALKATLQYARLVSCCSSGQWRYR